MNPFTIHHNPFNGAELALVDYAVSPQDIQRLLAQQRALGKRLLWLTLPIEQSALLPMFTEQGFVFHLCEERKLTLIHRLQADAFAPFAPTHTAGVGGLISNDNDEILLIRDRWMNGRGFKLPGGYIDLGESLNTAAEREVLEETGVRCQFEGIAGLIDKDQHAYNKANFYFVCRLRPLTSAIEVEDDEEIELAAWVNADWFIHDSESPAFHRHLVKTLRNSPLLRISSFEFNTPLPQKILFGADSGND